MPTPNDLPENDLPESWPPLISRHEPPPEPRSDCLRGWDGAVLLGLAGAVAGAVLLFLALLTLHHEISDGTYPLGFLIDLAVMAVVGAVGGFICGLGVWFVSGLVLRGRERRRLGE